MKKSIIAAGAAVGLAVTSFAGSATAGGYYGRYYYPHYHHYDYDPGPAIVAGAMFGMLGAAIANSNRGPYYGYRYSSGGPRSHVAWCEWRYKTYDPATDMFYARPGVRQYCRSPYD